VGGVQGTWACLDVCPQKYRIYLFSLICGSLCHFEENIGMLKIEELGQIYM